MNLLQKLLNQVVIMDILSVLKRKGYNKMRKEVEMLMAELLGMKKVLDPKASTFPIKNREFYQGEIVDSVIEKLEEILEDKLNVRN